MSRRENKSSVEKKDIPVNVEESVEKKSFTKALRDWFSSLYLGKPQAVMAAVSVVVLLAALLIFNNLSVSYARRWDIDWGYYSILSTFILLIAGIAVNVPFIAKHVKGFLPSGKRR